MKKTTAFGLAMIVLATFMLAAWVNAWQGACNAEDAAAIAAGSSVPPRPGATRVLFARTIPYMRASLRWTGRLPVVVVGLFAFQSSSGRDRIHYDDGLTADDVRQRLVAWSR